MSIQHSQGCSDTPYVGLSEIGIVSQVDSSDHVRANHYTDAKQGSSDPRDVVPISNKKGRLHRWTENIKNIRHRGGLEGSSTESYTHGSNASELNTAELILIVEVHNSKIPLFPLDLDSDKVLVTYWQKRFLPQIEKDPSEFSGLTCIQLFRQGLTKEDSVVTILASIAGGANKTGLHGKLSKLIDASHKSIFRIFFDVVTIELAINNSLPSASIVPQLNIPPPIHGAKVGIKFGPKTATLGGFVSVGGEVLAMTVNHFLPKGDLPGDAQFVTYPDELRGQHFDAWHVVEELFEELDDYCAICVRIRKEHFGEDQYYKPVQMPNFDLECEAHARFIQAKHELRRQYPSRLLGTLKRHSTIRRTHRIENGKWTAAYMDWSLFTIADWSTNLEEHAKDVSKDMSFAPRTVANILISATGATSGYQTAVISYTPALFVNDDRTRRKWVLCNVPGRQNDEWVDNGPGRPGDSGSWVFGENGVIYGMIWGRQSGAFVHVMFTPMQDIIRDIKESMKTDKVYLPEHERRTIMTRYHTHTSFAGLRTHVRVRLEKLLRQPIVTVQKEEDKGVERSRVMTGGSSGAARSTSE